MSWLIPTLGAAGGFTAGVLVGLLPRVVRRLRRPLPEAKSDEDKVQFVLPSTSDPRWRYESAATFSLDGLIVKKKHMWDGRVIPDSWGYGKPTWTISIGGQILPIPTADAAAFGEALTAHHEEAELRKLRERVESVTMGE